MAVCAKTGAIAIQKKAGSRVVYRRFITASPSSTRHFHFGRRGVAQKTLSPYLSIRQISFSSPAAKLNLGSDVYVPPGERSHPAIHTLYVTQTRCVNGSFGGFSLPVILAPAPCGLRATIEESH